MNIEDFIKRVDDIQLEIREHYQDPFLDGAFHSREYCESPIRILWLMKEPYGQSFSYTDFFTEKYDQFYSDLIKGRPGKTWVPVLYVSYAILNNFLTYDTVKKLKLENDKDAARVLGKIAWVNIQKEASTTGSSTYNRNIKKAWSNDRELIMKQIDILDPHLVICGNTYSIIREDFISTAPEASNEFVPYYITNNRIFIDPYHPSYSKRGIIDFGQYVDDIVRTVKYLLRK